ncbi:FliH/SctL family protein [Saccharospirillum salsuginis]|uniref:Flagellar assembly protein FliH n=1 Tax=Saccharospirillum salsuginis TaxID=418750 RepID=A0A918NIB9_9GAMM|nr:FliH/SctL family protein [Saccharospirillum salsuginis]GGX75311.1 hypothetical protein GCM10007392_48070 [Saccharospirillum salsuginis]
MTTLAIFDTQPQVEERRWSLVAQTRRIPKAAFRELEHADRILREAESVWQDARHEADALRRRAFDEGRQAGWDQALAETLDTLTDAQHQAQAFAEQSDRRVLQLAAELVRKILPRLSTQDIVDDLLLQALNAMNAGRYIQVRVHPDHRALVEQTLARRGGGPGPAESVTVVTDPTLDRYDCRVESELGRIEAGFHQQLAALLTQAEEPAP